MNLLIRFLRTESPLPPLNSKWTQWAAVSDTAHSGPFGNGLGSTWLCCHGTFGKVTLATTADTKAGAKGPTRSLHSPCRQALGNHPPGHRQPTPSQASTSRCSGTHREE